MSRIPVSPIIALSLLWSVHSTAAPLVTTVTREPHESPIVVRATSAGASTVERYRAARVSPLRRGPHVVIVRLPDINSPDRVTATASITLRDPLSGAMPSRRRVDVAIVTRRYTGPLAGNEVTTPYVEIELGMLEPGAYTVHVTEQIESFDNLTTALTTARRGGLSGNASFEVR